MSIISKFEGYFKINCPYLVELILVCLLIFVQCVSKSISCSINLLATLFSIIKEYRPSTIESIFPSSL